MIWAGRRYHLVGDTTHLQGMPSSLAEEKRESSKMVLYSKACRKCDSAEKKGKESEEHECPKNFEGSSKSVEASAILNMVEDAYYNRFFIIDVIVSDNDITIRAVLKHIIIGVRGQFLKTISLPWRSED